MDQQLLYVGPNHWDKLDQLKVYILEFSSCCLHTTVFVRIAGTIGDRKQCGQFIRRSQAPPSFRRLPSCNRKRRRPTDLRSVNLIRGAVDG